MSAKVTSPISRGQKDEAWRVIEGCTRNTPDWEDLKRTPKDEFYVFVTGNSRKDHYRNHEFRGCNYYGEAITWDNNFIMKRPSVYTGKGNTDPLVFNFSDDTKWDTINHVFDKDMMKGVLGDVYGVPLRRIAMLDNREGNTDGVRRVERWVTLMNPLQEQQSVRCFMYVVDTEFFLEYFSYSEELQHCSSIRFIAKGREKKDREAYYAPKISPY